MADGITPYHLRELGSGTPQRVAFDLMVHIAKHEKDENEEKELELGDSQKNREYWLTLYRQCRKATQSGISSLDYILHDKT
jgi:hypothetical protein